MEKQDNYLEENKRKMSLKTKTLLGAAVTLSLLSICGCDYMISYRTRPGIRTRPRLHYSRRYTDYNYHTGFRYPGYNPRIIQPQIRIPFGNNYGRTPSRPPRINTPRRSPQQRSPCSPTPGRSRSSRSRSESGRSRSRK